MRNRFCILWLLVLGDVLYKAESSLRITFLEDLCYDSNKGTIDLRYDDSGILMSAPPSNSNNGFECEILLLPPKGSSVVLSIFRYDLHDDDQLIIEDSDRHRVAFMGWGTFKDEKKSIVSDGRMTVLYKRRNTTSEYRRAGFQFTYTRAKNSPCQSDEFKCDNRKCVQRIYMCDGHNHCGDRSEQMKCNFNQIHPKVEAKSKPDEKIRTPVGLWVLLITIASLIVLTVIIVSTVVLVRRAKLKKESNGSNNSPGNHAINNIPRNHENNADLQTVSSNVPPQDFPVESTMDSLQSIPVQHISTSGQGSLRNPISDGQIHQHMSRKRCYPKIENVHKEHSAPESHLVPSSMYPSLEQYPSAPEMNNIDNPDFEIQE